MWENKFTGWGSFGTKVEQDRTSENVFEFVEVAKEHLFDGEELVKVERRNGERVDEWEFVGGGEFARGAK